MGRGGRKRWERVSSVRERRRERVMWDMMVVIDGGWWFVSSRDLQGERVRWGGQKRLTTEWSWARDPVVDITI